MEVIGVLFGEDRWVKEIRDLKEILKGRFECVCGVG
jgi:hypothetical protein